MLKWLTQISLKDLKLSFNRYSRIIIVTLIVAFFLGSYQICNYFYPLDDDISIDKWWLLKVDLYVLMIALCFIFMSLPKPKEIRYILVERFIVYIGSGFTISTFIDKRVFGTREYTKIDLLMVLIVVITSIYDAKRSLKAEQNKPKNE